MPRNSRIFSGSIVTVFASISATRSSMKLSKFSILFRKTDCSRSVLTNISGNVSSTRAAGVFLGSNLAFLTCSLNSLTLDNFFTSFLYSNFYLFEQ